jgi:hypothetical protein
MLHEIWDFLPMGSGIVQGGLGILFVAWPRVFGSLEKNRTGVVRICGISLAVVGASGAISGFQQQDKLATKADLAPTSIGIAGIGVKLDRLSGLSIPEPISKNLIALISGATHGFPLRYIPASTAAMRVSFSGFELVYGVD